MDQIERYRQIIRKMIEGYAVFRPAMGDVEIETIFDEDNDHYELMYAGWNGPYRIHGSVLHIDIRNGKVWIQYDGTEDGIANELVEAGIPRERIVLAFKPPSIRPHTDFAVA
ncbi:MAG: XisI protein [Chloroflexi bacterium]|nr:XisI protein [Chloroflexota bacterium]